MALLAFITSLRHPLNSSDYGRVELLLHDTLISVRRQEAGDFTVFVVGNQKPSRLPDDVTFLPVDFPPPSPVAGPHIPRPRVRLDKGAKLAIGLLAAREAGASHAMFFDADDFVSRRLAGLVSGDPQANGWYVERGWRYNAERAAVRPQRRFHTWCGTAHIVRCDLYGDLSGVSLTSSADEVHQALGNKLIRWFGSHVNVVSDLAAAGAPLSPIPFPAALYRIATGENRSWNGMGGLGRPVTRAIAEEFGVPPAERTPRAIARAVLPGADTVSRRIKRIRQWEFSR